jgi:putative heme-binding domain-containing protein
MFLSSIAWILGLVSLAAAQNNRFDTASDRAAGARLFRGQCAACHGPNGAGGAAGPDLTKGVFRRGDSNEALFQMIAKGIPGSPMPAFAGNEGEVWQIVAYVKSLGVGRGAERTKGDRTRGAMVFRENRCRECHAVGENEGGTLGPELATIGSRRSLAHLERALTDPNAEVANDYWTLRARTKSGQHISGIRLNEDTYSYQFRDASGLRAVLKADLAEHEVVRTSPMLSYEGKLSAQDFEDLIAYLASLRGEPRP